MSQESLEERQEIEAALAARRDRNACTCPVPVRIATLIEKAAKRVVENLDPSLEADCSFVAGSTFGCAGCGQVYVVNIVVSTLPHAARITGSAS